MKFNWGTGIAVFYSFFVVALVALVIRSTQFDNSLVSDHYYADDLAYQKHYDKLVNAQGLRQDLRIQQTAEKTAVTLAFPAELGTVAGEVHFFCPSDSRRDFRVTVRTDADFRQVVPTRDLKPGLWKIKVDWKAGGKGYYKEETLIF